MIEHTETIIIEQKKSTMLFSAQDSTALYESANILKELLHNADPRNIRIKLDGEWVVIPNADLRKTTQVLAALSKIRYAEVY